MSEQGYWNFDMNAALKQNADDDYAWVWLATNRGRVVLSYCCFVISNAAHWRGLRHGEEPIAWMHYEPPTHPHAKQGGG